jgi:hypothetical protein
MISPSSYIILMDRIRLQSKFCLKNSSFKKAEQDLGSRQKLKWRGKIETVLEKGQRERRET